MQPHQADRGEAEAPSGAPAQLAPVLGRTVSGNLAVNLAARVWMAALQLLFTPVYVALLGPESYGLIGLYGSIVVALGFLDQALSPVLTRELARASSRPGGEPEMRDLLRTLEAITIACGIAIGAAVFLLAPVIAGDWLKYRALGPDKVEAAVRLMGLCLACQWPSLLYTGGYVGLNRQQALNRTRVIGMTVQWAGAALVLWAIAPRIELFFSWQAASFALLSAMLAAGLWRRLPGAGRRPRFDAGILSRLWRFSLGTFAIGMTSSALTQADKLIVASTVPLERFAQYSLCFMIAALVSSFVAGPAVASLFPHFTGLHAERKDAALAAEYHRWTQMLMVVILPVCGALATFPEAVLGLWLGAASPMVDGAARLMPWIALGAAFNTVMLLPFCLQMASGWTRLSLGKNLVAIAVIVPVLVTLVPRLGPIVGAWCWFALNLGYYLIEVPLMHRRLLRGELAAWWIRDTLVPGAVALAAFYAAGRIVRSMALPVAGAALAAAIAGLAVALLTALVLPFPRELMKRTARRLGGSSIGRSIP